MANEELSKRPNRSLPLSRVAILVIVSLELLGAVGAAGGAVFFFCVITEQDKHMGNAGMVGGVGAAFIAIFVCLIPALALLLNWRKKWWFQVLPALAMLITVIGKLK